MSSIAHRLRDCSKCVPSVRERQLGKVFLDLGTSSRVVWSTKTTTWHGNSHSFTTCSLGPGLSCQLSTLVAKLSGLAHFLHACLHAYLPKSSPLRTPAALRGSECASLVSMRFAEIPTATFSRLSRPATSTTHNRRKRSTICTFVRRKTQAAEMAPSGIWVVHNCHSVLNWDQGLVRVPCADLFGSWFFKWISALQAL